MKLLAATAVLLAACIDSPVSPGVMCSSTSDCDSGEVCQEGTCWGNPPGGMYAATLVPPSDRSDLVSSEIPLLALPQDGWLGNVSFAPALMLSGRVEQYCAPGNTNCASTSLGATITITRKPEFAGGPGFHAAITAKDGVARGTDSFSGLVPPSSGDAFTVNVVPDGRGDLPPASGVSPAMIAPPLHTMLTATADTSTTFVLGSPNSPTISGTLTDGIKPLTKYRVAAIGQWDPTAPLTEVSSVAYETDGTFHLIVADGVVGPVEIVAKPYDPNVVAPTLHLGSVDPGATAVIVAQPQGIGNKLVVTIPVVGVAGSGALAPISGAKVIVTGMYDPMFGGTRAVLEADATTDSNGMAQVALLDGPVLHASYKVRVIPPADANVGVAFDVPLGLAATAGVQTVPAVRLPSRVALQGVAVDSNGQPLGNVAVTAAPSLRFLWTLDAASQQFLTSQVPTATTVTTATGDFVVWVDAYLGTVWGHYNLSFEPPSGSTSPSWAMSDIEIPRVQNLTSQALGNVTIPDAAFLHGQLVDSTNGSVASGELRIYSLISDLSLCGEVPHPPTTCVIPAQLVGDGTADDMGVVRLTLPRP